MNYFANFNRPKLVICSFMVTATGVMPAIANATPYAFASNVITGLAINYGDGSAFGSFTGSEQVNGTVMYNGFGEITSNQSPVPYAVSLPHQSVAVISGTPPVGYTNSNPGTFIGTRANANIGPVTSSGISINNVAEAYGNTNRPNL